MLVGVVLKDWIFCMKFQGSRVGWMICKRGAAHISRRIRKQLRSLSRKQHVILWNSWFSEWVWTHSGCHLWVIFAESGKLNTWGSTTELGQCYLISGKQQVSARHGGLQFTSGGFCPPDQILPRLGSGSLVPLHGVSIRLVWSSISVVSC